MGMVWGYVWGIWWWRCSGPNMEPDHRRTELCSLPRANIGVDLPASKFVLKTRKKGLEAGVPRSIPMDLVMCGSRPRLRNHSITVHVWNGFVAVGSICKAGEKNYVCSPEFCLIQIARYLKRMLSEDLKEWQYIVILAELCCELCGTYSKQNTSKGYKNRTFSLTSVGAITTYCGRMAFERGARLLREALAWTLDSLNSPMETVLYLLLCLPQSYGGLGFVRPFANYSINVPEWLWGKTKLRHIIPDLFWPEFSLIVEYNGEEPHTGREREDQERMEIAQDMGHKVITFRKEDLYDRRRFMAKAQSVATNLGLNMPEESKKFISLQNTLMDMLLRRERWI